MSQSILVCVIDGPPLTASETAEAEKEPPDTLTQTVPSSHPLLTS